mmetsp:Transcript_22281/g.32563  ORF Transcript_22281/g.32563 Transcript_22281/m.32563 type:complete len:148 (-) Transcript_22281:422-865(-)
MNAANKRGKGRGRRLTDEQRLQIIQKLESRNAPSMRSIAREYGVNEKSIRYLKKDKDAIKERISQTSERSRKVTKRASLAKFPELEQCLFDWMTASRFSGLTVTPSMLKFKAKQIAGSLGIGDEEFSASNGWYMRFRNRWNIGAMLL